MKINVLCTGTADPNRTGPFVPAHVAVSGPAQHDAPYVDYNLRDGALLVTEYDERLSAIGWTLYAAGRWQEVKLVEAPAAEVVRAREALDQARPSAGRGGFVAGNSGPM